LQTYPAIAGTDDLAFSPEGVFLSVISEKLTVWNTKNGKVHREISGPRFNNDILPEDLEYSPRGKYLVVSWLNGEVVWWKARTGKMAQSIKLAKKEYEGDVSTNVQAIDVHPTGRRLIAVTWAEAVQIWSFPKGNRLFKKRIPGGLPTDVEYSPQGNVFAISQGKEISFWESKTRKLLLRKKIHEDGINTIDFSPTGKYIATGAGYIGNDVEDNTVTVWKNPFYEEEPGERKGARGKKPPGSV
jgi:WD40 repeat protein